MDKSAHIQISDVEPVAQHNPARAGPPCMHIRKRCRSSKAQDHIGGDGRFSDVLVHGPVLIALGSWADGLEVKPPVEAT